MVMATPIIFGDDEYVVEMLKDITEMKIVTDLNDKNMKKTKNIISELNKKIVTDELTGVYNRRFINAGGGNMEHYYELVKTDIGVPIKVFIHSVNK